MRRPRGPRLSRRVLLGGAAAGTLAPGAALAARAGDAAPDWMLVPGRPFREYGAPAPQEADVGREILQPYEDVSPGAGVAMTPLEDLEGTITPNGLHFERSHNGVPAIDPLRHELLIHGEVERKLLFTPGDLQRYPMVTRVLFIECAGNSFFNSNAFPLAVDESCGMIHGLVSTAEWTGVPLSLLLGDARPRRGARWLIAEGADANAMSRSLPLEKALDDVLVALYQNGERIRPEQGYPMRLVVPGWEGNLNVKWLRRLKVVEEPVHARDETSKYSDLRPDGKALQFTFPMDVKSVITRPSGGQRLVPGFQHVSGLAWSGHGAVRRVEVSADGGTSWQQAALDGRPPLLAPVRFRMNWTWDGAPATLLSRATDQAGHRQETRAEWSARYAHGQLYHCNAIQSWRIEADGSVTNVYL